ncbi:MAG: M20/M25/M40 family metallo-hydrolase [Ignavibacteria bacterium]|nr:M20/M25/M40 family metallo-hydrolase [Ignavibacteria bacterium]
MRLLVVRSLLPVFALAISCSSAGSQVAYDSLAQEMLSFGLRKGEAYALLTELTTIAGHRLSGSRGAEIAVDLTKTMMEQRGFDNVHLEPVMVPHWVRGPVEEVMVIDGSGGVEESLTICALGGSIGTPEEGIEAPVVEVQNFDDLRELGSAARGKIIFMNRGFDHGHLNAFAAYGGAVDQRSRGAIEAAKAGAVGVLVRSMTHAVDDVPHTGAMNYEDGTTKIPAAAISTLDADRLSGLLKERSQVRVRLRLSARTLEDVQSYNVIGQLTGSEFPDEIIVVGGHLDSWDKGTGAHDDGAGCMQAIEAVNLLKRIGLKPKRTIRAVMFMNEENGVRGGNGYPLDSRRKGEAHVAALESDRGGFAPRGISVHADSSVLERVRRWQPLFELLNAGRIEPGYGGVDIAPLVRQGVPGFGLVVETHRYFDYHHSDNDTIEKVNPRELQMGAIVEALLCYLISEEGL